MGTLTDLLAGGRVRGILLAVAQAPSSREQPGAAGQLAVKRAHVRCRAGAARGHVARASGAAGLPPPSLFALSTPVLQLIGRKAISPLKRQVTKNKRGTFK